MACLVFFVVAAYRRRKRKREEDDGTAEEEEDKGMGIGPGGSRGSPGPHLPLPGARAPLPAAPWPDEEAGAPAERKRKKTKKVKMARRKKDGPQGGPDVAAAKEGDEEAAVTAAARGHPLDGLLELQAATSYHTVAGRWEVGGWAGATGGDAGGEGYLGRWVGGDYGRYMHISGFARLRPSFIAFPNSVLLHHRPSQWPDLRTPARSASRPYTVALLLGS